MRDPRRRPALPALRLRDVGDGVQAGGDVFCCAHRARESGREDVNDRADD